METPTPPVEGRARPDGDTGHAAEAARPALVVPVFAPGPAGGAARPEGGAVTTRANARVGRPASLGEVAVVLDTDAPVGPRLAPGLKGETSVGLRVVVPPFGTFRRRPGQTAGLPVYTRGQTRREGAGRFLYAVAALKVVSRPRRALRPARRGLRGPAPAPRTRPVPVVVVPETKDARPRLGPALAAGVGPVGLPTFRQGDYLRASIWRLLAARRLVHTRRRPRMPKLGEKDRVLWLPC